MKKIQLLLLSILTFSTAMSQEARTPADTLKKNIVKLNVLALPLKNISVQYERAVARKISAGVTLRLMPFGSLPFKSTVKGSFDDEELETQLENAQFGNFAIMPEIRFYLGRKGVFRGFYIAPFASIARYKTEIDFIYEDDGVDKTIPMSGKVNTFTGGLMFGAQWKLSKKIYLDWWILGPNAGTAKGDISGRISLSPSEQQSLREELDDLDIPLTKFEYEVNAGGADIHVKGPWAGVRSGLCIGINF